MPFFVLDGLIFGLIAIAMHSILLYAYSDAGIPRWANHAADESRALEAAIGSCLLDVQTATRERPWNRTLLVGCAW
jgi:hypothetical protein